MNIYSVSEEGMKIARDSIEGMTAEAEIGKIYRGRVVTIKEFGAFVEFLPGRDGFGPHQRTGEFPGQTDGGHREDGR